MHENTSAQANRTFSPECEGDIVHVGEKGGAQRNGGMVMRASWEGEVLWEAGQGGTKTGNSVHTGAFWGFQGTLWITPGMRPELF